MIETILHHARSYLGTTQGDKKHRALIDKYNAVKPLPVGYEMKTTDDWCAAFVTVMADLADAASYVGRECGVQRFRQIFKQKGIWLGGSEPRAGDIVVFDWRKDGWADHIGIVEKLNKNIVTVIEGNTSRRVARRTYKYNDWRISGYARPKYPSDEKTLQKRTVTEDLAREVIVGKWGNGEKRKQRLSEAGYDPTAVQETVNRLMQGKGQQNKTNKALAREVLVGKWGDGKERKTRLTKAGYHYEAIQKIVNQLM